MEGVIRESFERKTLDNVTVVMICFNNLKNTLFPKNGEPRRAFTDKSSVNSVQGNLSRSQMNKSLVVASNAKQSVLLPLGKYGNSIIQNDMANHS